MEMEMCGGDSEPQAELKARLLGAREAMCTHLELRRRDV